MWSSSFDEIKATASDMKQKPNATSTTTRRRGGGAWNSLHYLLDHARSDIKNGLPGLNPYVREFATASWCERLHEKEFYNLVSAKRLKKEIIEAYGAIQLIRRSLRRSIGVQTDDEDDGEGLLFLDLCSGKGCLATLLSFVFPKATIIMVDNDTRMKLPHVKARPNIKYHYADIRSKFFMSWARDTVMEHVQSGYACDEHESKDGGSGLPHEVKSNFEEKEDVGVDGQMQHASTGIFCGACDDEENEGHSKNQQHRENNDDGSSGVKAADRSCKKRENSQQRRRLVLLIGIHLCGTLSSIAIQMFNKIPQICSLILAPCCNPKRRSNESRKLMALASRIRRMPYELWCWMLFYEIKRSGDVRVDLLRDHHLIPGKKNNQEHAKNVFIWALRKISQNCLTTTDVKYNEQ